MANRVQANGELGRALSRRLRRLATELAQVTEQRDRLKDEVRIDREVIGEMRERLDAKWESAGGRFQ